jgi:hypothetical protein
LGVQGRNLLVVGNDYSHFGIGSTFEPKCRGHCGYQIGGVYFEFVGFVYLDGDVIFGHMNAQNALCPPDRSLTGVESARRSFGNAVGFSIVGGITRLGSSMVTSAAGGVVKPGTTSGG